MGNEAGMKVLGIGIGTYKLDLRGSHILLLDLHLRIIVFSFFVEQFIMDVV